MTYPDLPISCDHFRSFAAISNHFQSFLAICDDFYLRATSCAHCDTAEVLQFSKTVAEDTSMSVYQNSEAASAYRFSPMMRR